MANDLRVGIVADASSFEAGMDRATATIEEFQAAAGNSAEKIEVLSKALADAEAAGLRGNEAFGAAVAALREMEAQSVATAEAVASVAATEDVAAAAGRNMASGTLAANGAMRVLEGSMMGGTRAAASFLSTTLGLGPVLAAAFPVIGAAALGMVIVDVGKELDKFIGRAEDLARETDTDWLTGAIGQMDGLAEAVKQADAEIERLNKDLDSTKKQGQAAAIENIRLTRGDAAAYHAEAEEKRRQSIANEQQLVNLVRERADLEKQATAQTRTVTSIGPSGEVSQSQSTVRNLEAEQQLAVVKKQIADYQATNNVLLQEANNLEIQATQVKQKKPSFKSDNSDFAINRLMAEEAVKDEEKITKAIAKENEERGKTIVQMVKDNEFRATESERITEEITATWEKSYNEDLKHAERVAKEKEALDDKIRRKEEQAAKHTIEVYRNTTDRITDDLNQGVDAWLRGGERMSKAWTDVADHMAISVINALIKIAAQELIGAALHKTIAADQRLDDAKSAAAGAYKALVGIPYIGPILAPIAAGVAFAAVEAFDVGSDYVPKTGMAIIHEGERIIPSGQNEQITRAIAGGKSGQVGDNHFHYSPSISGIDGASVAGMARQHSNAFFRQAGRQMRLMGRTQG